MSNVTPCIFTLSAFLTANILKSDLTLEEQHSFGHWLELVGQAMITNVSQQILINSIQSSSNNATNSVK